MFSFPMKWLLCKFKFNFRKIVKKVCSIWGKFSWKEQLFWQGFHQGKQNHNSLLDCQVYYKYETMKIALSLSTNLNKYKSQGKQWIVLQRETEETSYSKLHDFKQWVLRKMFQNNGYGITSCDNYLIHDKWKNSKNQHPFHSFAYRCITKLNQKRTLVHFVLFPKV